MSGGGGKSTTNTVATPWSEQQPFLTDVFNQATQLYYNGMPKPYSGGSGTGTTTTGSNAGTVTEQQYMSAMNNMTDSGYLNPSDQAIVDAYLAQNPASGKRLAGSSGTSSSGSGGISLGGNAIPTNSLLAPAYYSGNTIADQSPYTRQAYSAVAGQAKTGDNSYNSMGTALTTANNVMNNAISGNTGLTNLNKAGNTNSGNKALTNLLGTTGTGINAGNAALANLQGVTGQGINSGNLGLATLNRMARDDNPYIDKLYQRANSQAQASLDSNFNRAGRYGSGAHEAAAADAANNLANQMYGELYDKRANTAAQAASAYSQGIGQGLTAQQAAGQMYGQGIGQGLEAQQAAGSIYNTGWGNNIAARNDAANAYNAALGQQLSAAGTANNLFNQRYTDAQWLSEIGANQENYNQALIDAAIDRYNYDQQRALTALSNYNQLIQGTYGGTTTATGKGGYTGSALGSALGGAAAGASLLSGANSLLDYFK